MKTFAINEAREPSRIGSLAIVSGALFGAVAAAAPALSADLPDEMAPYRYYGDYYNYGYHRNCDHCGWRPAPAADWSTYEERIPVTERKWVQRDYIERRYPYYSYYTTGYEHPEYWSRYRNSYYYPGPGAAPYQPYLEAPRGERSWTGFRGDSYPPYAESAPRGERFRLGFRGDPYPPYADPPPRGERSRFGLGGDPYRSYSGPPHRGDRSRRLGFRDDPYPPKRDPYLPKPAAYESDSSPRVPYGDVGSSRPYDYRPGYEYDYYRPSTEYRPAYEYEPSPRPPGAVPGGYGHGYSGQGDSE